MGRILHLLLLLYYIPVMTSSKRTSSLRHRHRRHETTSAFWSRNDEGEKLSHDLEPDYLPMDQTVIQDPVHQNEQNEDQLASLRTSWINPEHPERRPGRFATEDDQTEFVRMDYSQTVYKKVRTYSEYLVLVSLLPILKFKIKRMILRLYRRVEISLRSL